MQSIITSNNHSSHSGFLNSSYKNIVKQNFKEQKSNTIFGFKQRLKSTQLQACCSIETTLKISLFLIGIIVAFN